MSECACCGGISQFDRGCCDGSCHCHFGVPSAKDGSLTLSGWPVCKSCDAQARGPYYVRAEVFAADGAIVGFVDIPVPVERVRRPN